MYTCFFFIFTRTNTILFFIFSVLKQYVFGFIPSPPPNLTLCYLCHISSAAGHHPPSQNLHFNSMMQSSDRIKWTLALDENSLRLASLDAPRLPYALFKTLLKIFLKNKEIRKGAGEKSYMRKEFLIYEELREYLFIYEEGFPYR
jgi:hypothetical protein